MIEIRRVIIIIPSSTLVGALVLAELKDRLLCIFLEERGWCPKTPLSQHLLPSLIGNCLSLPFGTRGRSRRPKPFSYKQEMGDKERLLCPRGPHRVLLGLCSMSFGWMLTGSLLIDHRMSFLSHFTDRVRRPAQKQRED